MSLTEIEFELTAQQYELLGYPGLHQGEALSVVLDTGVLLPDPLADGWFAVQPEPVSVKFQAVGPALYAFAGQIVAADLFKADSSETGVFLVDCGGGALVRCACAPQEDGALPWGTWETRYLTGFGRVQGIIEEDFRTASIGRPFGVTIWRFRRLILTPGDAMFGQWHETVELLPLPYRYDRVYVTARIHRNLR